MPAQNRWLWVSSRTLPLYPGNFFDACWPRCTRNDRWFMGRLIQGTIVISELSLWKWVQRALTIGAFCPEWLSWYFIRPENRWQRLKDYFNILATTNILLERRNGSKQIELNKYVQQIAMNSSPIQNFKVVLPKGRVKIGPLEAKQFILKPKEKANQFSMC